MTQIMESQVKLIHVARILANEGQKQFLFLRKISPREYLWYKEQADNTEIETDIKTETIEQALRQAARKWKNDAFCTVICGFRYTLPERDEHGMNALFHQMVASYSSMNGIYYDEELANNCFVQNASIEARQLWQRLQSQGRL